MNTMVSTRGPKFKFSDGEKVLCYEPDPTKAKVLYDSKVLNVIVNKDQRGRKAVEYLIHFQGWNSSWDRCVTEEYVLKDTEENRQLQRDLAQKAQLQIGAYLYRKERCKRSHKFFDRSTESGIEAKRRGRSSGSRATSGTTGSSEDGSSGQNEDYDTEDNLTEDSDNTSDSVETEERDSEDDGPQRDVDIKICSALKKVIEQDHELINQKNMLAVLPAQPTVISILESWVLHYTNSQLTDLTEKRHRNSKPDDLQQTVTDINICRQTAEGIRIYFDVTLDKLLLYKDERTQCKRIQEKLEAKKAKAAAVAATAIVHEESLTTKDEIRESEITIKEEVDDSEFAHLPPFKEQEAEAQKAMAMTKTKRTLRSCRVSSVEESKPLKTPEETKQESGNISSLNSLASTDSRGSSPQRIERTTRMSVPSANSRQIKELLEKASKWRLVPADQIHEWMPSNTYGAIHLARLFVKLPELLARSDITDDVLKATKKYIDMFLSYLEMHKEWFGEQFYMPRACFEESIENQ